MGPIPILEMARAYGLRPRLWLLMIVDSFSRLTTGMIVYDSSSVITGPIVVRKRAAVLFRREKFILLQVCTRKKLGTRCSRDFACAIAGELSSTITNFFGRLTI